MWVSAGTASNILNLDTSYIRVVSFMPQLSYFWRGCPNKDLTGDVAVHESVQGHILNKPFKEDA